MKKFLLTILMSILVFQLLLQTFTIISNSPSISKASDTQQETTLSGDERLSYFSSDDDITEFVIGLNDEADEYSRLETLISKSKVNIINQVAVGGKTQAIVVNVPLEDKPSFIRELKTTYSARYIEPRRKFHVDFTPNDPYWPQQWGPVKIEADHAWDVTMGNSSILVAVIDTGVDWNHPDLAANYVALGYDWVNGDSDPMDDNGHGTHCAGIIAAVTNNGVGTAGLAQVRVMAEKGLDSSGSGYDDDLANAIVHAVDQGAKILSNSWGGYDDSAVIHDAVTYASNHGVLVVAAAGNGATSMPHYPAAYDEVVGVTATDSSDAPASFTNFGNWVDVAAPGVNIYSTMWDDTYQSLSGTSMACPHVAGVAALVWSRFPTMTANQVRNQISYTADDLGTSGFDIYYGHGRVNAKKAVEGVDHDLLISSWETPSFVEPGSQAAINITVHNFGTQNESSVTVRLLANGTIVYSASISFLESQTSTTVYCHWTPTVEGQYNVTAYVVPVPGETATGNNVLSKTIPVCSPTMVLWDDTHDGDGDSLTENYLSLYQFLSLKGFAFDELTTGTISSQVLSSYRILVVIDPEYDFSNSEITDIHNWVAYGGKLLVIVDSGYPDSIDTLMAPYGVQMTGWYSGTGTTTNIVDHTITENVDSIYYNRAWELDVTSPSQALAWTAEYLTLLSATTNVVVIGDSNLMDNSYLENTDNKQLMLNIFNFMKNSASSVSITGNKILNGSTNTVYFIYADPAYMTRPEATYDVAAGEIVRTLCANTQRQGFNTTRNWLLPSGAVNSSTISGATVAMFGGPCPHISVRYYENAGLTPVRFQSNSTHFMFTNQAGVVIAILSREVVNSGHEDLILVESFVDGSNTIFIAYGFDWKGTWAGGIHFRDVLSKALGNYPNAYYIFHWVDDVGQDGIPQSTEIHTESTG